MKFKAPILWAALLLPVASFAQNTASSPQQSSKDTAGESIVNKGWTSVTDRELRPITDPASDTRKYYYPKNDDAGYWRQDDKDAAGVMVIHFIDGSAEFEKNYGNTQAFAALDRILYDVDLLSNINYITVTGAASPDGITSNNEKLAEKRAMTLKNYIAKRYPYLNSSHILAFSAGEDWRGLRSMIEDDLNTPGREEALRLLNSLLPGDVLRERLKEIAGGTTYTYISKNMFPVLRGGAACTISLKEE